MWPGPVGHRALVSGCSCSEDPGGFFSVPVQMSRRPVTGPEFPMGAEESVFVSCLVTHARPLPEKPGSPTLG